MSVTKQLMDPIDFHSRKKNNTMEVNNQTGTQGGYTLTVWLPTFFKMSFFCV